MIPSPAGIFAHYSYDYNGKTIHDSTPVIAFDDEGYPLVMGKKKLIRTELFGENVKIEIHASEGDYTHIMPGGGWRIEFTQKDGAKWDTPLLAWAIRDGLVDPLYADGDGDVSTPYNSDKYNIYHPDEKEFSAPE